MIEYKVLTGRNYLLGEKVNSLTSEGYRVFDVGINDDRAMVTLVKDDYSRPTNTHLVEIFSNLATANEFVNGKLAEGYKLDGVGYSSSNYICVVMHKGCESVLEYKLLVNENGGSIEPLITSNASEGFILEEVVPSGKSSFSLALMKRYK